METASLALSARQLTALLAVVCLFVLGATFALDARLARAVDPGVPVVFVATGGNFPDALAGGALAAVSGGPLLFVNQGSVPPATDLELKRLEPQRIVVFGGTGVVSQAVEDALATYTNGPVDRLSGSDRFATAAEISQAMPDAPFAAAGHDHGVRRTNIGSLPLQSTYGTRSSINFDLDDTCGGGATRWRLFATAHASARALSVTMDVDLTITLDSTEENEDARTRATIFDGNQQGYQNLALQALFDGVEPGDHTLRLLARKAALPNNTALTMGRMTLMVMGYDCV